MVGAEGAPSTGWSSISAGFGPSLEQALVTTWYRVVYSVVLEALVEVVIQTYEVSLKQCHIFYKKVWSTIPGSVSSLLLY